MQIKGYGKENRDGVMPTFTNRSRSANSSKKSGGVVGRRLPNDQLDGKRVMGVSEGEMEGLEE